MHARLLQSLACLVCALTLIGALARGASPVQATPSTAELERAATLEMRAERQERAGRLGEAQATWIELASLLAPGAARDAAGDRARSVELRLQLRREVAEACSLRRDAMREAGLVSANEKELQTTAAVVPWLEVDFMLLDALVKVAKVSTPARLGLVHERIARQTPKDVRAALADLGLLVERGVVPAAEAWSLVARTRGEPRPERGYRFEGGRWVRVDDAEVLERAAGLAEQVEALRKAKPKGRDAAFDALLAFGEDGKAAAMVGLRARCEAAVDELGKRGTLAQLARLADEARDLAERRQAALALIFDEDRYFYPYNPPECPPERAKLYAGVQREVMRLVESVRELWNRNPVVKLPAEFRAALDEVRWARRRAALNGVELGAGVSLPSWLEWLDLEQPSVDLRGFALAKAQRDDIARSRAVLRAGPVDFGLDVGDGLGAAVGFDADEDLGVLLGLDVCEQRLERRVDAGRNAAFRADADDEEDAARREVTHRLIGDGGVPFVGVALRVDKRNKTEWSECFVRLRFGCRCGEEEK